MLVSRNAADAVSQHFVLLIVLGGTRREEWESRCQGGHRGVMVEKMLGKKERGRKGVREPDEEGGDRKVREEGRKEGNTLALCGVWRGWMKVLRRESMFQGKVVLIAKTSSHDGTRKERVWLAHDVFTLSRSWITSVMHERRRSRTKLLKKEDANRKTPSYQSLILIKVQ